MVDFNGTPVSPGEPITATAWNEIVRTLHQIRLELMRTGSAVVIRVTSPQPEFDIASARVTASQAGALVAEALKPLSGNEFVFPKLLPGTYALSVDAPGLDSHTRELVVPEEGELGPIAVTLPAADGAFWMPALVGKKLPQAISDLGAAAVQIIDAGGEILLKTGFDPSYNDSVVLVQFPPQEGLIPAQGAMLLVSAPLGNAPTVTVPDLRGMTLSEAERALAEAGLNMRIAR